MLTSLIPGFPEPQVGIHILRQREASSSDGLESNGSEDPGLRVPHGQMGAGHAMGGHSQTPTPPSDPEQMQQQGRVQQQASHSQQVCINLQQHRYGPYLN